MVMKKEESKRKKLFIKLAFTYLKYIIVVYLVSVLMFSIINKKFIFGVSLFKKTQVIVPYIVIICFETIRIIREKK